MDSYHRRPPGAVPAGGTPGALDALGEAGAFLKRLIPFPGGDGLAALSALPTELGGHGRSQLAPDHAIELVNQQAAAIVSQAASILDEEMARGVLTARQSVAPARQGPSSTANPVLRQVHELVDNVAAAWPQWPGGPNSRYGSTEPAVHDADPLAELRPRTTVRPGQHATVSLTLYNHESAPVHLVPSVTDLLGSGGGRIAGSLLTCTPRELQLDPHEQQDLAITMAVPAETAPGCYSGLLVVRGVNYLRALITIDVV